MMNGSYDLDKFLEQFDDNGEFNPVDDTGRGFDAYNAGSEDHCTYPPMQYYGDDPNIEEYPEQAITPATRVYGRGTSNSSSQNRNSDKFLDEVEEFGSSDTFGYGMSSPTPSQPRGFVAPAALHAPTTSGWAPASQQTCPSTPAREENPGYAYRQSCDGISGRNELEYSNNHFSSAKCSEIQDGACGSNPRDTYSLRLRPVSDLPDMYRGIFKFGVFNAVQSKCYQTIMETTENIIVSAPTGGGKTVLFELGIIAMSMNSGHHPAFKCVYVAPTKALCSERMRDWAAKFEPLGIKCCEMTGDTVQMGKNAWTAARTAKIIITTSEKWDSLTRGWHDHGDFLSEIRLFLVDEVHVLNELRGSTLEVIISRMKARSKNIRFILVSATVPNIRDIANWIGNPSIDHSTPATVYEFGEEYRPCKIMRHIYGYPRKNQNDFQFSRALDFKLYSVLEQHACGKPILIFCSTRKGVLSTAEQLLKEYEDAVAKRQSTVWTPPTQLNGMFHDKRLEKLAKAGLGIHHAGLNLDDRRTTEDLYLDGSLRVVCATSTLAVGVNLPHTVVIKGVKLYVGNAWQEYSDLDVVQMIGRAGRPQFDKEGVAIIMCEQELENKYRNLAQGKTILESSLHENLLEHLNSEIGIGAISDIQSAKEWLRNSFLRQRIQKNPGYYHIGKMSGQTWEEKMDDMVMQAVKKLESNELVSIGGRGDAELTITDYGDIMSKYYIRQSTMGSILKLSERPTVREIIEVISCAEELRDVRLRGGDKQVYNKMKDLPDIRYKIKKVEKAANKAFILIQAVLGGISLSAPEFKTADSQPALDALSIFRHTTRIARVVVEVAIIKENGAQLKHGLELVRCLTAKAWEDRPVVLKQIESIGEKSLKVLAQHGITSFQILREQEPSRIEMLLNRRPPYGHEVLQFVRDLPQYRLSIAVDRNGITTYSGAKPISIELKVECCLLEALAEGRKPKQRSKLLGMTSILTTTSDLNLIDFRRTSTKALRESRSFTVTAELTKPSQSIYVLISSENFAGLTVTETYKPSIPAKEFPTMDTHPKSVNDMLVEACEQGPHFLDASKYDFKDDVEDNQDPGPSPAIPTRLALEPRTLPNGNYVCNHNCKDKNVCRHLCCREGTTKPPSATKKTLDQKIVTKDSTTLGKKGGEMKLRKKPTKEDKRLEELETLHRRSGANESLRLNEGRRIKLDLGAPIHKPGSTVRPNFDVEFAELKADKTAESSDDMPDTKELLAFIKPSNLTKDPPASDNSFPDPELDAIMLAMDTSNTSSGSAVSSSTSSGTLPTKEPQLVADQTKRKEPDAETPGPSVSPTFSQPPAKKTKLDDQETTETDNHEPLFLRHSSSPQLTFTVAPDVYDTKNDDFKDEDYFALDNTIFNIVSPSSSAQTAETIAKDVDRSDSVSKDTTKEKPTRVEHKQEDIDYYDDGMDEWADIEDWLLNSGSVQIVG